MKKIIFYLALMFISIVAYGQEEDVLTMKGSSADTDTIRLVKDGESALMLKATLFAATNAELGIINDTIDDYGLRLIVLEADGYYTASNGLTVVGKDFKLGGTQTVPTRITTNIDDFSILTKSENGSPTGDSVVFSASSYDIDGDAGNDGFWFLGYDAGALVSTSYFGPSVIQLYGPDVYVGSANDGLQIQTGDGTIISTTDEIPLSYDADYSANYTARSIPDSAHVAAMIAAGGGSYTFQDGITESGGIVSLGGSLTQNTYIDLDGGTDLFQINVNDVGNDESARLEFGDNSGQITLWGYGADDYSTASGHSHINVGPTGVYMRRTDAATDYAEILISDAGITVRDDINSKGLVNSGDFSASTTARSLIDKAEIEALIAAGTGGDTLVIDSVAWMLSDTLTTRFSLGLGHSNDTAAFFNGAYMGGWHNYQDTVVAFIVRHNVGGTSADVDFQILYSTDQYTVGGTVVYQGTSTTVGATVESESFTNKFIPPDVDIWCEIDGAPAVKGIKLYVDFGYGKTR